MDKFIEIFKEVWQVELYRGALLAVGVFFAMLLLYWILKIVFFCKFGKRRCSRISVDCERGNIVVSANAVSAALRAELKSFPELAVNRVILFCKRARYSIEVRATLVKYGNGRGLPELFALIEPLVKCRMAEIFGVKELSGVVIRIDNSDSFDDYEDNDVVSPELPDYSNK